MCGRDYASCDFEAAIRGNRAGVRLEPLGLRPSRDRPVRGKGARKLNRVRHFGGDRTCRFMESEIKKEKVENTKSREEETGRTSAVGTNVDSNRADIGRRIPSGVCGSQVKNGAGEIAYQQAPRSGAHFSALPNTSEMILGSMGAIDQRERGPRRLTRRGPR